MYLKVKLKYFRKNWKLCVHLLIGTRHFGVNNQRWSSFPSTYFGNPLWQVVLNILTVYPIIRHYKAMKYRAKVLGFMHPDTVKELGWSKD